MRPPPRQTASLFSILCPQSIHSRRFTGSRKSLLLNTLRDSRQSILSKADTRKVFRTKHLSGAQGVPHPSPLLARVGNCWVAGFQRSLPPPKSRSPPRQHRRRALTAPETGSSVSHCILRVAAELRRKRIPQNEGNHNSQKATLRRAPRRGELGTRPLKLPRIRKPRMSGAPGLGGPPPKPRSIKQACISLPDAISDRIPDSQAIQYASVSKAGAMRVAFG